MDPNLGTAAPGKRGSGKNYDPLHRDDFWDAENTPELSSCKSKLFYFIFSLFCSNLELGFFQDWPGPQNRK